MALISVLVNHILSTPLKNVFGVELELWFISERKEELWVNWPSAFHYYFNYAHLTPVHIGTWSTTCGNEAEIWSINTSYLLFAGVKDVRFQVLTPDVLHWLGIMRIDNMVSMSDIEYNAIVGNGKPTSKFLIGHPYPKVETDAKIVSGYLSSGKQVTNIWVRLSCKMIWKWNVNSSFFN